MADQRFIINHNTSQKFMAKISVGYRSKIHNYWQCKSKLELLIKALNYVKWGKGKKERKNISQKYTIGGGL